MNKITFEQFLEYSKSDLSKIETKIGTITNVERIPKNKKMIKIIVNFGNDDTRTVISNIGNKLNDINNVINSKISFITNLENVTLCGNISEAMLDIHDDSEFLDNYFISRK